MLYYYHYEKQNNAQPQHDPKNATNYPHPKTAKTEQLKRYRFQFFFLSKKAIETTHQPSQVLQPDHNTVKIQLTTKLYLFKTEENSNEITRQAQSIRSQILC